MGDQFQKEGGGEGGGGGGGEAVIVSLAVSTAVDNPEANRMR